MQIFRGTGLSPAELTAAPGKGCTLARWRQGQRTDAGGIVPSFRVLSGRALNRKKHQPWCARGAAKPARRAEESPRQPPQKTDEAAGRLGGGGRNTGGRTGQTAQRGASGEPTTPQSALLRGHNHPRRGERPQSRAARRGEGEGPRHCTAPMPGGRTQPARMTEQSRDQPQTSAGDLKNAAPERKEAGHAATKPERKRRGTRQRGPHQSGCDEHEATPAERIRAPGHASATPGRPGGTGFRKRTPGEAFEPGERAHSTRFRFLARRGWLLRVCTRWCELGSTPRLFAGFPDDGCPVSIFVPLLTGSSGLLYLILGHY